MDGSTTASTGDPALFLLIRRPQSNVLLFRRPIGTDGRTGQVDPELAAQMKKKFRMEYGLE